MSYRVFQVRGNVVTNVRDHVTDLEVANRYAQLASDETGWPGDRFVVQDEVTGEKPYEIVVTGMKTPADG